MKTLARTGIILAATLGLTASSTPAVNAEPGKLEGSTVTPSEIEQSLDTLRISGNGQLLASSLPTTDTAAVPEATYPIIADPIWIPIAVLRCLAGIGLNGRQITALWGMLIGGIQAAFGYAAARCIMGR